MSSRGPVIVAHGGVGTPASESDGCVKAVEAGLVALKNGLDALEAVVAVVAVLEDDERYNAGTGSRLRLNGVLEMDAIVGDSRGRLGAVAAIRAVRNPVEVALKVTETPHVLLAGPGATRFARHCGFEDYNPEVPKSRELLDRVRAQITGGEHPAWSGDMKKMLDHYTSTVGAVVLDREGLMAAATSSGGTPYMIEGRVGDTPVNGSGQYVGADGAVAATGVGERIMEKVLSFIVYQKLPELGMQNSCQWGVDLFSKDVPMGLIGLDPQGNFGVAANKRMAWAAYHDSKNLSGDRDEPPGGERGD
jgi:L-asparaginase/beta-aspartyl-peptidase (threonine type)